MGKCRAKDCERKRIYKYLCARHYAIKRRTILGRKKHKCKARNCKNHTAHDYCRYHNAKLRRGLPLDNKKYSPKGKRNVNWKGGIFLYPNHYLMKKNRLIIFMNNPKCEGCGNPATEIHHIDANKSNHTLSNLKPMCRRCHMGLHVKMRIKLKKSLTLQ